MGKKSITDGKVLMFFCFVGCCYIILKQKRGVTLHTF